MRKQKVIKMTASPLDPNLSGAFEAPASHNGDISIVFRNKDMSIHGWDGSEWSTIYTRNGADKQFMFPHTYENYYVKSLTGSEETFSASFFSVDKYQGSTPLLAGVQRGLKLHDVDEVPIYTASDVNKLLTVMSDGSLRWLGISESYVVEVIGTGGESQTPAPSLLSQSVPASDLASYNAETDVMTFNGSSTSYATFAGEYSFPDAITIATWFKTTATGMRTIMSSQVLNSSLGAANGWRMILDNGRLKYRHPSRNSFLLNGPSGLNNGEWQHVAITWTPSGYALYVNGVENATGTAGEAVGTDPNFDLHIGAIASTTTNNRTNVFSGQIGGAIVENEAMTAEQIQAIYDNGPEYVETIGPVTEEPAEENPQAIAGTFLEELQSATDNAQQNAEIVDGVFFRTKAFNSNGSVNHDNTRLSMTAVDLEADGIISYTNNVADTGDKNHVEFSMSFWFKPAGGLALHSMFAGLGNGFSIRTDGNDITVWYLRGGGLNGYGKAVVSNNPWTTGEWEHVCLVVKEREDDPTKWAMYIYQGGQPLNGGNWIASTDSKLFPDSNVNSMFGLGGQASTQNGSVVYNGMDGSFYLDSFQIGQGVVLTDEQVAAIAAQTDRQMSIETAALPAETPVENPQVIAGTFLEELSSATTNLLASSTIENGILVNAGSRMSRGTFVELDAVGIVEYNSGESTDIDFTWSGWFNPTNSGQLTNIMTMVNDSGNYRLRIAGQNWNTEGHRLDIQTNGSTSSYNSVTSEFISSSGWVHYAATYETTSTNQVFKLYINGLLFKEISRPLGARILHPAGGKMYIGGNPALYGGETGQLDSFQIKSGVVLTADQIAAIAAQTDRQMSIETAAS